MNQEHVSFLAGIAITLMLVTLFSLISKSDRVWIKQIEQAQAVCENNGGLLMINGAASGRHQFVCLNGAMFFYSEKD